MRLYPLGPGEILDRLTILALKILYGEAAGKDVVPWVNEYTELLFQYRRLHSFADDLHVLLPSAVLALAAANAAIWHAEDLLRARRQAANTTEDERGRAEHRACAGELAFQIQAFNDRRARYVHEINRLLGAETPKEKLT